MTDPKLRTLTGLLANEQTQPTLCHHSETSLHPPATSPRSVCRVYDCILCLRSRSVAPVRPVRATGEAGPNDVGVHGPEHSGCSRAAAGHTRILATTKNSTSHAFATLCVVGSRRARPGTPRHAVLPPGLRTVPHGAVQQGRQRECTSRGRWQTEQKPAARRSAKLPPAPSRTCHPWCRRHLVSTPGYLEP